MNILTMAGLFLLLVVPSQPIYAPITNTYAVLAPLPVKVEERAVLTENELKTLINKYASGLDSDTRDRMFRTAMCESGGNRYALGELGERGLVQILPSAWPEIKADQAFDPDFAINFLVTKVKAGHGHYWTCWGMI